MTIWAVKISHLGLDVLPSRTNRRAVLYLCLPSRFKLLFADESDVITTSLTTRRSEDAFIAPS